MKTLDHVPNYKKKWHEWSEFAFSFLQWLIHKYLMANGILQLYTAKRLEKTIESQSDENMDKPMPLRRALSSPRLEKTMESKTDENMVLSSPPPKPGSPLKKSMTAAVDGRDHKEVRRRYTWENFQKLWEYNFGSLMHQFVTYRQKRDTKQILYKRHHEIVADLQSELEKLTPGVFHNFKDVTRPLLRKWKGGVLLEADCNVGGKIFGELSVSLHYLLKLHPNLFEMQTTRWSKTSREKKIRKIKLVVAQSAPTDAPTGDTAQSGPTDAPTGDIDPDN